MRDGEFELLLIRPPEEIGELSDCIRSLQKQTYDSRMVTFRKCSHLKIYASAATEWTLDGEHEPGHSEIEFHVLPKAIGVILNGQKKEKK